MKCIQHLALAVLWAAPVPVTPLVELRIPEGRRHDNSSDGSSSFSTQTVQKEIEQMAHRADRLAETDKVAADKVVSDLEDVEAALETRAGGDAALAKEIHATRAALCAKQAWKNSHDRADCVVFMRRACLPNEEQFANQSTQTAQLLPKEICRNFFLSETTQAPAAAPKVVPKEWFSKELQDLPEQGLSSDERVEHEDGVTQTDDWQREFGPKAGHRGYRAICRDHPDNKWCRLHMKFEGPDMPTGWSRTKSKSGLEQDEEDKDKDAQEEEEKEEKEESSLEDRTRAGQDEEEKGVRSGGGAQSRTGILAGAAILWAVFPQLCA